ncbi:hypothetical protein KM043_011006 [Ampulex compressa]|nr:hypothetical protein KM043_011006 [Ampulex compressa]
MEKRLYRIIHEKEEYWAFGTVETVVSRIIEKSLPVAKLMEKPIYTLDKTLCQGLDFVEVKLPIIKEEPEQILNRTKSIVTKRLRPAVKTFIDLKQETKQRTVDNTTDLAELMLDKYLPATQEESYTDTEKLCSEHAKLHHTMERLSEFSTRATRRIYFALTERLQHMYKIEILILILHAIIVIQTIKFVESMLTFIFKLFSDYVVLY